MRRQSCRFLVGTTLLALLGIVSCGEETPTYLAPIYQVGALEGYVRVAGEPRSVTVGAREFERSGSVIAKTQSGEDGWYRLELPVDRYRIEVNPGTGRFSSRDTSDVVRVEPRSKRLDLLRSRLVLRVETPESMYGLWLGAMPRSTGRNVNPRSERRLISAPITEFVFDLLEPETFKVLLDLTGATRYWVPGTYDEDMGLEFTVQADRETVVETALSQHASLSGTVVGSWQQVERYGPNVEANNMDGQHVAGARTAEDGTFQLHLLLAEPVKIRVGGYGRVEQWIGGTSFETAKIFHPQAGADLGDVDLVESGIQIQLAGPGSFFEHRPRFHVTDGNGWEFEVNFNREADSYAITNLLPGRYFLHASGTCAYSPQPWSPQWYGGAESFETAAPIDLPAGSLVPITMQLQQGGTIEGKVKLDDLVQGIRVGIFDTAGTPLCQNFPWSENGEFNIPGLLDGDYLLATIYGSDRWFYPGTLNANNAVPISVRNGETVSGIIWTLELR